MLKFSAKSFIRSFSSSSFLLNRPPLLDLLPKKSAMNKLLFDADSRLPYTKIMPIYEAVYQSLEDDSAKLPHYTTGGDLMSLRIVLQTIRKQTRTVNVNLVDIENELVEKAAELGDNDAITILAFETVRDPKASMTDKKYAKKLISQLDELKHPLASKLGGDYAFQNKLFDQAEKFYLDFLKLENDTLLASEVYKTLGFIHFQKPNLVVAKEYFEKSVRFGSLDRAVESHFYLGQLYHSNPKLAKYHLELAASKGLKETFPNLGLMELNYFGNYKKALEWFKLGMEVKDVTCLFGALDCYYKLKDSAKAIVLLNQNKKVMSSNPDLRAQVIDFLTNRPGFDSLVSHV